VSKADFIKLNEIIKGEYTRNTAIDDKDLEFISEINKFCNLSKDDLIDLFKGKKAESLAAKIEILTQWMKEKEKEKGLIEEETKKEEEDKILKDKKYEDDIEEISDGDSTDEDDVRANSLQVFGLLENYKLVKNIKNLSKQLEQYSAKRNKDNLLEMEEFYSKVYKINHNNI
jgi:hypothetical protein